jgi:hypothetical protein
MEYLWRGGFLLDPTLLRTRVSAVPSVYYKLILSSVDCRNPFPLPSAVQ